MNDQTSEADRRQADEVFLGAIRDDLVAQHPELATVMDDR